MEYKNQGGLRRYVYGCIGFSALTLQACGGGGGGSTPAGPSFTLDKYSIIINEPISQTAPNTEFVQVTLNQIPETSAVYVRLRSNGNTLRDFDAERSAVGARLNLYFLPPSSIPAGQYNHTLEVTMCLDSACASPIAGSGASIAVSFNAYRPVGAQAARVTATASQVTADVLYNNSYGRELAPIGLTYTNVTNYPYVSSSFTDKIQSVNVGSVSTVAGDARIRLKAAELLPRGAHAESVVLAVCFDSTCANQLDGSPLTVQIDYNISNVVRLANGNVLTLLEIPHGDFVWSANASKFFLTQPPLSGATAGKLLTHDPLANGTQEIAALGAQPGPIAVTSDGQFVYVGDMQVSEIKRISAAGVPSGALSLGNAPSGLPRFARDIDVAPGDPTLIAVATGGHYSPIDADSVFIFRNGNRLADAIGPRMDPITDPFVEQICWGQNSQTLYGLGFGTVNLSTFSSGRAYEMSVSATGVTMVESTAGTSYGLQHEGRLRCQNGLAYTDEGKIYNPATNAISALGTYPQHPTRAVPDAVLNKVFALQFLQTSDSFYSLRSFDATTHAQIASVPLPIEIQGRTLQMVRWGVNGVAFSLDWGQSDSRLVYRDPFKYVVLVTGPLVTQ